MIEDKLQRYSETKLPSQHENPKIDSNYTREEAVIINPATPWELWQKDFSKLATSYNEKNNTNLEFDIVELAGIVRARQEIIEVNHFGFNNELRKGQIIADLQAVPEIQKLFQLLRSLEFPINKVIPAVAYDLDDNRSMSADASGSFLFRKIAHKPKLSVHSLGIAIDLNPKENPMIIEKTAYPKGASYDISGNTKGTITAEIANLIKEQTAFKNWGGEWQDFSDYQHFQIPTKILIESSKNPEDKRHWEYIEKLQEAAIVGS
jgi:hypothetical protein